MRLLLVTQVMDSEDPVLGFMTRWVTALAQKFETITVICLKEGAHALPSNVSVYSLGKPHSAKAPRGAGKIISRIVYTMRFWRLICAHKNEYDTVLVHMNQEYVLLGVRLWRRWDKRIYMWRNHYSGNRSTDRAMQACDKVFSTSRFSYTARSSKNVLMPVGVDTDVFKPNGNSPRDPRAILSLGRIAPSKRIEVLLRALGLLQERGITFTASLYGSPLPQDQHYADDLKTLCSELGLDKQVRFLESVPQSKAPELYTTHSVFVNCSQSGMYDKTLFEAAASECLVLASSQDFKELAGPQFSFADGDSKDLAQKLEALLSLAYVERQGMSVQLRNIAKQHSLEALTSALAKEMTLSMMVLDR